MTLKRNFLIFTVITFLAACTSTPFTELNSRDNFQLEEETSFKIQLNKDLLPCLLYTSPSPRDRTRSRMPSSA